MKGDDLEAEVPVAPWEAVAGSKANVMTADGVVSVRVPEGSRSGMRLRVRGKGLARAGGGRGDFYAVVRLALPDNLDAEQRELLERAGRGAGVSGGARIREAS